MTTPRRAPQRFTPENFLRPDPLADASVSDEIGIANELVEVFEALRGFDQSSILGYLYRKPAGGLGKFEFAERLAPPFEMGTLLEGTRERFGGGDYRLQIFAGGKTRKNVEFSIMGPAKPIQAVGQVADSAPGSLMQMMMAQQAEARREAADFRREAAEDRRHQVEQQRARDDAMWRAVAVIVPVVAPLMLGGREKLADLLALVNSNKPDAPSLKDQAETLLALKTVFADDKGGGFDPDNIAGSLLGLVGPVAAAAGRAFNGRGKDPAAEGPPGGGEGFLELPGPDPAPGPPGGPATLAPASAVDRVLNVVRPHIAYFYSAQHDPGLAAEAITDIMGRHGITDADVNELVAAFTLSPDWKADLAAQGLDLRSNPGWADEFLMELVGAWSDRHGDGDDRAGRAGRVGDAGDDATPGAAGLSLDADTGDGA
jgi:hypothetical protein